MKCHEARQFIGPYLDSELDAKTSLEIEQHIEACSECRRFFADEEELDERTFSALRTGGRTPALWASVESAIQPTPIRKIFGLRPLFVAGTITAVAAIVLGLFVFLPSKSASLDLAVLTEERHHEYASKQVAPEFTGELPDAVAQKLGDRLDASAFAFSVGDADFSVQGARVCRVGDVPAAWILGSYKGTPVSMMVFKEGEIGAFRDVQERFQRGETLVDCSKGHCEIVARIVNGHVVCLVAGLPKPLMQQLAMAVQPPREAVAIVAVAEHH